jgi:F420-0:gamma-glutamyl ligase-like protein
MASKRESLALRIRAIKVKTGYWTPGTDYIAEIAKAVEGLVKDGDVVVVSEKAISTAKGLILDESRFKPSLLARILVKLWTRRLWGGPLGRWARLRPRTLRSLRDYPLELGSRHKEVALRYTGLLQALRHYSEGGIDASNLPYSYVSLPLPQASVEARKIQSAIASRIGKKVQVLIVDSDKSFSWRNLHLAPRRIETRGLIHLGGFLVFLLGRMLGLRPRATPVASLGIKNPDLALTLAEAADRVRGYGAGRTVWEMAKRFGVDLTGVTWRMLGSLEHYPIVILRLLKGLEGLK